MNVSKMRIRMLLSALLMLALNARGQQRYSAALPAVSAPGFYRIVLSPEITAYSARDLRDLRVLDASGKEVPFLCNTEVPLQLRHFQSFPIVNNAKDANGNTRVLLHSPLAQSIEAIELRLRNTAAERFASISGSPDGHSFYSLRDSVALAIVQGNGDTGLCNLPLPATSYPWLQLTILDAGKLPLELFSAGIYQDSLSQAHYVPVPAPRFRQVDSSDHHSYVHIRFDKPYLVERLTFRFGGPPLYRREARLLVAGATMATLAADNRRLAAAWGMIHDTAALLVVDNEDNPALQLTAVEAAQREQQLIAYLHPGQAYTIVCGDTSLKAPVYDLRYFKDSIGSAALPQLVPGSPAALPVAVSSPRKPFIGNGAMWAIILLVLAGLIAATVALMKQIRQ